MRVFHVDGKNMYVNSVINDMKYNFFFYYS